VIEALGLLKDARALPVLTAILDDTTEDADTTRSVTEAIARIGTDEAATRILTALDTSSGDRTRAIVGGMGECRRLRVTEALASRIRSTNDEAIARIAARSLGRAGNAWAWSTVADRSEETQVRGAAARALVASFVRTEGEARAAASNALMVVDAPETPSLIAEAKKGASGELSKALDALADRFANNPSRTR
jgi:HEAT repeat protein